ncbi:hypothetical protein Esi_0000_0656 [Ectocarpus siliculosus]|uniref:EsV-1-7 n=1 Tax=Ectocarpus siliculosus TaxID=2880 RepID=D8LBU9_ECTSI|nr:hypothetical protein Esi_0000_0656 [Ectocarpus siliculosus]|eukprot:CBN76808.1 hypothetical protein Esi_0000_0656 [Ectocarpus siliculosus]
MPLPALLLPFAKTRARLLEAPPSARPGATSNTMSFGMEQARERLRQATAVCASVESGYWQHRSRVHDKQEQVIVSAAERGYQAASTPPPPTAQQQQQQQQQRQQPKDHLQHPDVAARYGGSSGATADLGGRSRLWNTENEQQQQQSAWRKLKKLDHHHHHPRQISPSLVSTLPAVLVETGPLPPLAGAGAPPPYKRTRKTSAEEHQDFMNAAGSAAVTTGVGPYHPFLGSPEMAAVAVSEASSRGSFSSTGSSPALQHNHHGFYPATAAGGDFSASSAAADPDHIPFRRVSITSTTSHDWEQQREMRQPRAGDVDGGGAGGSGAAADREDAAAAVRVLGLRNGHASAAAAAAVAATEPLTSSDAVVAGSKRFRDAFEESQAPLPPPLQMSLPPAVKIVRPGGGAVGPPTTMTRHGRGGGAPNGTAGGGGRRPSTGMRQRVDRSKETGTTVAPKGAQACRDVGCHRRPIYAFKGDTKALCCPIHRSAEMVNVRHPLCRHESCFRQPSFGMEVRLHRRETWTHMKRCLHQKHALSLACR